MTKEIVRDREIVSCFIEVSYKCDVYITQESGEQWLFCCFVEQLLSDRFYSIPLINSRLIENIFSSLKIPPRVYKIECYLYILELDYIFRPFHREISSFSNYVL